MIRLALLILSVCGTVSATATQSELSIPTKSIAGPAPMTGLVLWSNNPRLEEYSQAVALEFQYFRYDEVASGSPETGFRYDWTPVREFLAAAARRGHHGILRFRDTDPQFSRPGVPESVRGKIRTALYTEGIPGVGPATVSFPDWSQPSLVRFVVDFYRRFAAEFDGKPLSPALLQVGFGLWGEYHLDFDNLSRFSDPSIATLQGAVGRVFPSRNDQVQILSAVNTSLHDLPWGISIDAADTEYSPFEDRPETKQLSFGLFDDSFLADEDSKAANWSFFGPRTGVNGGEISYYSTADQEQALSAHGPHGVPLAAAARTHGLTYLIGDGQTEYRSVAEIAAAGKAMGYHFAIRSATTSATETVVVIENTGTAAANFDIWPTMGGVRSPGSLRGLAPGATQARTFRIPATGPGSDFSLTSDRLLAGQVVPFEGN